MSDLRRKLAALLDEGRGSGGIPFDSSDGIDPNDRVRQKTQSRAGNYPYDTPVMYGRSTNTDANGSSYMDGADQGPPLGRETEPDQPMTVWDRMSDMTDHLDPDLQNVEIGPTGQNAASYGYGRNGLREVDLVDDTVAGILDLVARMDLELTATQDDFTSSYRNPRPMKRPTMGLLSLLGDESYEDVGDLGIFEIDSEDDQ